MKKTLCALLFGINSIIGCNTPVKLLPEGGQSISIPKECVEVESLINLGNNERLDSYWQLTCKDDQNNYFYYYRTSNHKEWIKYEILKQ